ncbi:LysR family transcriptional regulator [Psychromonas sp. KJ10-2]|uniref:LysR family transcriptional regulator n=1 Tax=Psychromonas sp. KJ10-2 TaxID=3391822 RepID=UPI0039B6AD1E
MTFDQLKTFLWVAKLGAIRQAAHEMNLSQPAISARIYALENELGVRLFERQKTGVVLTKEGILLRAHAEKIESYMELIKSELTPNEEVKGIIRIGVAETVAQSWLSDFLTELRKVYPKLVIELSVDITIHLREQLLSRNLDLAFLMGPLPEGNVENIALPKFELSWFCSVNEVCPDPSKSPIFSFSRLSRPYHELVSEIMHRYGSVGQIFPSNSLSTSFEMIASGIGIGALPTQLAQRFINDKRIKKFEPGWIPNDIDFTASYLNDPRSEITHKIAILASEIANQYANSP